MYVMPRTNKYEKIRIKTLAAISADMVSFVSKQSLSHFYSY